MKTDIFIGIDIGSSSLKAVAFEAGSGATLATAGGPLPHIRKPDGTCELTETALRAALAQALQGVSRQLGPRVEQLRAIGCTGHGAGLYALGPQGDLLLGCAVASTDQRAAARAQALSREHGAALFNEVGCRPWAGQPTLIAAELLAAGALQRGEIRHLLFAKDYLAFLLTGEMATDASDASTAGLLSLATGRWSSAAFEATGLSDLVAHALPPLVPSGTAAGRLQPTQAAEYGLPAGVPVVTGAIDLLASLLAVGAAGRGQQVAVLGTWCVNVVVAPVQAVLPPVAAIVNAGLPNDRLYMENSPSSMANIAWLARTLQFPSAAAVVDCAMSVPLGAEGLRFAPFINSGGPFPGAKAGFIGLANHHGRAQMARAVVDAVMALHAHHLTRLSALGLGAPGHVAVLGGGARDARLVRVLASMLGHTVERCGDDETGARGAALLAAQSQGIAADALPAPRDRVEPDTADVTAHQDFCVDFTRLMDSLAPAFAQLPGGQR